MADPTLAISLASAGISLIGGFFQKKSEKKQYEAQQKYLEDKYNEYDLPFWEMSKEKIEADYDETIRSILLQQQNEQKLADFKDANNLKNYQQSLKIHQYQIDQQQKLYDKSEELYSTALGLNFENAQIAKQREADALREETQKYAFQNEDSVIESIIKKGELAATSQAGRSSVKANQSELADLGRSQAIMTESLVSAGRNTRMRLLDIERAHKAADYQAYANRMLEPDAPPEPLKPMETPTSDYLFPRELEEFDFGPQPIMGVNPVQVSGWGSILANAASTGLATYANYTPGTPNFNPSTAIPTPFGSAFNQATKPSFSFGSAMNLRAPSTSGFGGYSN
tara:strand:+ start:608 stop:1627 length:1020 start_codon:yes stop_codon:yes gene_type:complete